MKELAYFRHVDVVPPQTVAAKVTVLYVAVYLNLRYIMVKKVAYVKKNI